MSSALFGILQLDRGEPLGYGNLAGLVQAWLQDAGGFAALGLVVYLLYALSVPTHKSASEKLRVPVPTLMVAMTALAFLCYAPIAGVLLAELFTGKSWTSIAGVAFDPPAAPIPPPGSPIKVEPPVWHWQLRPMLLMVGGLFALVGILQPFVTDLLKLRWRRIGALTKLGFKEALRSRLYWIGLLALLPFLFRNVWMAGVRPVDEFRTLVAAGTFTITILVLITAVLLAAFSIPNDIKNLTIHTVVTKPIERFEIVLGRFFGYTALMTLALVGMAALCLLLINTATIDERAEEETAKARVPVRGRIEFKSRKADFEGTNVGREFEYRKYIAGHKDSPQRAIWHFGSIPSGLASAGGDRVPVEFTFDIFRMTKGEENRGVDVTLRFVTHNCPQVPPKPDQGGEWQWADGEAQEQYRAAVAGLRGETAPQAELGRRGYLLSPATLDRQRALSEKVKGQAATENERKELASLERLLDRMKSLADRLRKAGVEVSAEGGLVWAKPVNVEAARPNTPDWTVANAVAEEFGYYEIRGKNVYDYEVTSVEVPAGLFRNARSGEPGKETTREGTERARARFSTYVKCDSGGQLLGMAEPDLYLMEGNKSFSQNFLKGVFGLWCRLCIVIGLAVACSTYLSGVLALLATVVIFMTGYFTEHLNDVAYNRSIGGGPFESMSRLVRAETPTAPSSETAGAKVLQGLDQFWGWVVRRIQNVIPDVESFSWTHFVSEGFNINTEFLVLNLLVTVGYLLPWGVLAYYLMKSREIAA